MSATEEINQDKLIKLVEIKPEIWDKTNPVYKDNYLKNKAWDYVCGSLKEEFSELDDAEKQSFVRLVRKKWTNMKDTWVKHNRRIKKKPNQFSGRKYYFYDKMKFLAKVFDKQEKTDPGTESSSDSEDSKEEVQKIIKKRKFSVDPLNVVATETEEIDSSIQGVYDVTGVGTLYENSRIMNFFRSIAPTVDNFSEDNFVEFQYLVLSIVKQMKQSEKKG